MSEWVATPRLVLQPRPTSLCVHRRGEGDGLASIDGLEGKGCRAGWQGVNVFIE